MLILESLLRITSSIFSEDEKEKNMLEINGYIAIYLKLFIHEVTDLSILEENVILMIACIYYFIFMEHGWRNDTGWTARWSRLSISHKRFHC